MSTEIDNRVVQMEFDNAAFERGVRTSVRSLEDLKRGLDLDKATASLSALERTFDNFSLNGLENAVDSIADKFTMLGIIGQEVMQRVASAAVDAGAKIFRALTTDNMGAGWFKYEEMMNATQAMKNASGDTVDEISKDLQKLMKYTDETSYKYSELVTTMSQFNTAGMSRSDAELMVEGLSNAAADAGIGIREAYAVYNNFSRAVSSGHMAGMQYTYLKQKGFFTPKMMETMLKAAEHLGKIDKKGRILGKQGHGKIVNAQTFDQMLQYGIIDNDVMLLTAKLYQDTTGEIARSMGELGEGYEDLGKKAYEAAQKSKTFTDVMDSVRDAISSGWMQSYERIFGGLDDAINFWSIIGDGLLEVVSKINERRNAILDVWKQNGGYEKFTEIAENFSTIINGLYDSYRLASDIFNSGNTLGFDSEVGMWQNAVAGSKILLDLTDAIKGATDEVKSWFVTIEDKDGETSVIYNQNLIDIFRGFNGVTGIAIKAVLSLTQGFGRLLLKFKPLGAKLVEVFGKVGVAMNAIYKYIDNRQVFEIFAKNLFDGFNPIVEMIPFATEWLDKMAEKLGLNELASEGFSEALRKNTSPIAKIVNGLISLGNILTKIGGFAITVFSKISAAIAPYAAGFVENILDMAAGLGEWITKVEESGVVTDVLQTMVDKIGDVITKLQEWGNEASEWINSTGILEAFKRKFTSFNVWLNKVILGRDEVQQNAVDELKKIQRDTHGGNVNLIHRPEIQGKILKDKGWDVDEDQIYTLLASTRLERFGKQRITFGITPIMENGETLSPEELNEYIKSLKELKSWEEALKYDKTKGKGLILPWAEVPAATSKTNTGRYIGIIDAMLTDINDLEAVLHATSINMEESSDGINEFTKKIEGQTEGIGLAQKALQGMHEKLTQLAEWFNTHSISGMLSNFFGALSNGFSEFLGRFEGFLTADTSNEEGLVAKFNKRLDAFKDFDDDGKETTSALNRIIKFIQNINTFVGSSLGDIISTISNGDKWKGFFEGIGKCLRGFLDGFTKDLKWTNVKQTIWGLKILQAIGETVLNASWISGTLSSITEFIDETIAEAKGGEGDYDVWSSIRLERVAKAVLGIGLGLAAIAWSIEKLASIDALTDLTYDKGVWKAGKANLTGGLAAFTLILTELGAFMKTMGSDNTLASGKSGFISNILFGSDDWTRGIKYFGEALSGAVKLLALAATVKSLVDSVEKLSKINIVDTDFKDGKVGGGVISGLGALGIILTELGAFITATDGMTVLGKGMGIFTASKLKAIGTTVKSLADSVKILSEIPAIQMDLDENGNVKKATGMVSGLTGLFLILGELATFLTVTNGVDIFGDTKFATFKLKALADAVSSLSKTVLQLSEKELFNIPEFDENGMIKNKENSGTLMSGLAAMFILLEELALFLKQQDHAALWSETSWGTFKLAAISNAVKTLSDAVTQLSKIEWRAIAFNEDGTVDYKSINQNGSGLIGGLTAMFVILGELALFLRQQDHAALFEETSFASLKLYSLAVSVRSLAETVKILSQLPAMDIAFDEAGKIDFKNLGKNGSGLVGGLGALFVLLEGLVLITKQFNGLDATSQGGIGAAFTSLVKRLDLFEIASAVDMLVNSMIKLKDLKTEQLITAVGGVSAGGGILYVLDKLFTGLHDGITPGGAWAELLDSGKLILMGTGLNSLADGIVKLSKLPWNELGTGIGGMIGAMVVAGGGAVAFREISFLDVIKLVGEIGTFVEGCVAMFVAIDGLNDWIENNMNKGLAEGETPVTVADKLHSFAETLGSLGEILGSFFGGIVGGFLAAKDGAQQVKSLSTEDIIAALQKMGETAEAIPFKELKQLEDQIQIIKELGGSLVFRDGDWIRVDVAEPISSLAWQLDDLARAVENMKGKLDMVDESYLRKFRNIVSIMGDLVRVGNSVYDSTEGDPKQIDAWVDSMQRFFGDLNQNPELLGSITGTVAGSFVRYFNDALVDKANGGETNEAAGVLALAAYSELDSWYTTFYEMGQNIGAGVAAGIGSPESVAAVAEAVSKLSSAGQTEYTTDNGIESPSKVYRKFGEYIAMGAGLGIEDGLRYVTDAMADLTYDAQNAAQRSLENDWSYTPTITPVIDTENLKTSSQYAASALKDIRELGFNFGNHPLETELVANTNSDKIIEAIDRIGVRITDLEDSISSMQIVMNGGALVGQIGADMDRALGLRAIREGRRG